MLNEREYSDVSFRIQDRTVYAHKVILAARSSHFRAMFSSGMRESSLESITLADISIPVFTQMLEWIYTNDLSDPLPSLLVDLLEAADRFMLDELKVLCESLLIQSLLSRENLILLLFTAHRFEATSLLEACFAFISRQLQENLLSLELVFPQASSSYGEVATMITPASAAATPTLATTITPSDASSPDGSPFQLRRAEAGTPLPDTLFAQFQAFHAKQKTKKPIKDPH
mmetsp:Transcript_8429/g.26121  ORF Transcript_8429/g.26121 Transcript_8429/m.26121 type:complete len:229 (+) Transcript_8429:1326-2012(+)